MPPKRTSNVGGGGRAKGSSSTNRRARSPSDESESNPFESSEEEETSARNTTGAGRSGRENTSGGGGEQSQGPEKTIPQDLLTRLLHEFFAKDSTRISRDANAAVGKYIDVFVREAIARTAVEKRGGFLEVEDLEKVTPQLLMDL